MRSTGLRAPPDIKNWRTQLQPIRTTAEITAHIQILPASQPYLYQKLSRKAIQMRLLGMSYRQTSQKLKRQQANCHKNLQVSRELTLCSGPKFSHHCGKRGQKVTSKLRIRIFVDTRKKTRPFLNRWERTEIALPPWLTA